MGDRFIQYCRNIHIICLKISQSPRVSFEKNKCTIQTDFSQKSTVDLAHVRVLFITLKLKRKTHKMYSSSSFISFVVNQLHLFFSCFSLQSTIHRACHFSIFFKASNSNVCLDAPPFTLRSLLWHNWSRYEFSCCSFFEDDIPPCPRC